MKDIHQHSNTVADVNTLSIIELSNVLYHIAENTKVSQQYTREFITKCLLRASELLGHYNTLVKVYDPSYNSLKNCDYFAQDCATLPTGFMPNPCMWHGIQHEPDIIHVTHPCTFDPRFVCLCCEDGVRMCMQP